jgi:putative serine protease PepD
MTSDRRRSNFLASLFGALVVGLPLTGLAIGGAFDTTNTVTVAPATTTDAAAGVASAAPARSATDVSALYARVSPGVVSVETQTPDGGATGSGFVLDGAGYILTNDHVVAGSTSVRVRFDEGGPVTAKLVGTDESTDLALL